MPQPPGDENGELWANNTRQKETTTTILTITTTMAELWAGRRREGPPGQQLW
jgi:hypothetical protein